MNMTFTNNKAIKNGYGIDIEGSTGNTFSKNQVSNNTDYGFYFNSASGNILDSNTAQFNNGHNFVQQNSSNTVNTNNNFTDPNITTPITTPITSPPTTTPPSTSQTFISSSSPGFELFFLLFGLVFFYVHRKKSV